MDNWKEYCIPTSFKLKDVLKLLNSLSPKTLYVVDDSYSLLGSITDGDIRRGLLKESSLDSSVVDVMKKNPFFVSSKIENPDFLLLMKEKKVNSIPIISNSKVIGIKGLQGEVNTEYENPVLLMAGGYGQRLRPLTEDCPKPMLKVGQKPMMEILLNRFKKSGFKNFYISTLYKSEVIEEHFGNGENFGVSIKYLNEPEPLGTGGALGLIPKECKNFPMIICNADILTKVNFEDLLKFHKKNKAAATIGIRRYQFEIPYGVVQGNEETLISIEEKPLKTYFVNAGIYVLNESVVRSVKKNQRVDLPDLLKQEITNKNKALVFPIHEYWLDIGRLEDFKKAQIDINTISFNEL